MTIRAWTKWGCWLAAVVVAIAAVSCSNPTADEQKAFGELIRELLVTDNDASTAFSLDWLVNQTGTDAFVRTIDSIHRGFKNQKHYTDTKETQGDKEAFSATVVDTIWGTLSYRVGTSMVNYRYSRLLYQGFARFLRLGSTTAHPNPWWLWRMEQRYGSQLGVISPFIEKASVSAAGDTRNLLPRDSVRLFRDSVLTLPPNTLTDVTIQLQTIAADDSFFVTYPRDGVYYTEAMAHDSVSHTATVQVRSSARFEVLGIQGFKRKPFTMGGVSGASAAALQSILIRFYAP